VKNQFHKLLDVKPMCQAGTNKPHRAQELEVWPAGSSTSITSLKGPRWRVWVS